MNCLHGESNFGKDGFIKSSVKGPDVLLNSYTFPTKNVFDRYKEQCVSDQSLFSIEELNMYHRRTNKIKIDQKLQLRTKLQSTRNICSYDS